LKISIRRKNAGGQKHQPGADISGKWLSGNRRSYPYL